MQLKTAQDRVNSENMRIKKKSALRGLLDRSAPCGRPALREVWSTTVPLLFLFTGDLPSQHFLFSDTPGSLFRVFEGNRCNYEFYITFPDTSGSFHSRGYPPPPAGKGDRTTPDECTTGDFSPPDDF